MGFGHTMAKGLITATTKFGTPDDAARRIHAICDTFDFNPYAEQKDFAQHAVKTLIGLRDTVAMDVLTLLASKDISYAETAIAEIKKIGSRDYAETLAAIGLEFSSLRDEAWGVMVDLRGKDLATATWRIAKKGNFYQASILDKLLSSGSSDAIDAAAGVFYLDPENVARLIKEGLRQRAVEATFAPCELREFFEAVSCPKLLRPYVERIYDVTYTDKAFFRMDSLAVLKDLFKAADNSGVLDSGVRLQTVLDTIIVQAEEKFAAEILHDTMHNPAP